MATRKCAANTRGRPFQPGNPGKPRGARNRASLAADVLLDGQVQALTEKAIELALEGDTVALRLCLDRIVPVRRDRPVMFALPTIERDADLTKATAALLSAVAQGDLSPGEAAEFSRLLDSHIRAVQATDFQERLEKLEKARS